MTDSPKPTVLIVDDDPHDLVRIQQSLQERFELRSVSQFDPYRVMNELRGCDVVLVDLYDDASGSPRGLEVINALRAAQLDRQVPMIVISSYGKAQLDHVIEAIENGGAQDFFWKHGPHTASAEEMNLKVWAAYSRARDDRGARARRTMLFRAFLVLVIILATGTVVSTLLGSPAATISFESLLVVLTLVAALPQTISRL